MLKIVTWPDPILRKVAESVPDSGFGPTLEDFGRQMIATMLEGNGTSTGIGLAATQVGVAQRVFVMTFPDHKEFDPLIVVNPTLQLSGETLFEQEGCVSFPGIYDQVARSATVTMDYQNALSGEHHKQILTSWDARVAQHEFDHINGIMFFDRMSRQMRKALLRQWESTHGRCL
jgi:peptide deformylase